VTDPDTILRIAARGDGVTGDGRYAALAAPGDLLRADGSIEWGPHHVDPPCRHFPECGGCQLQHLSDDAYADYVRDRVIGALEAQGIVAEHVAPAHISPPRTRRRATLTALRSGNGVTIGFHAARSRQVVDMKQCEVLHPALFALVAPLRRLLASCLPKRAVGQVSMTLADQGVDLLIEGIKLDGLAAIEAVGAFAAEHALARMMVDQGDGPETHWAPDPATITFGGVAVSLPPNGFLQATADGEQALLGAVRQAVGDAATVADLFAGLGTFTLPLALRAKVYAGEAGRDAVMALKSAANAAQRPVFVEHRDLYRRPLTTAELSRFGAVVLDPPRAGAQDQVAEFATATTPRIAYVSCNPSSFARDAAVLVAGGYRLTTIQPVGQFRWSTHIELAARFER
jgi:23S rRNA (uracil1939-C5)-methyltransferase